MLRSPSLTGVPPTDVGGPDLVSSASILSALENPNRLAPAADPSSKQFPSPPPVAARTLAAVERSEISRRILWSITASLAFLALVGVQLAQVASRGEINPLKLLKVLTGTITYILFLLLFPFTHHIRKIELGVLVDMVLDSLLFSVSIGLALYSEDVQELVMFNLIFLHIVAVVNSGVVSIKYLDLANTGLTLVANPILFFADKHGKSSVAFRLIIVYYFLYSDQLVKFIRDFEAKLKVPQFPEVIWHVKDILDDVWGRMPHVSENCLRKENSCVKEPLLRSHVSRINSPTQEKGPSKQLGGQTFVSLGCDVV